MLALAASSAARAQEVEQQGRGDRVLDERIRLFLADPATRVLIADTLLATGDTLRGPVAIIGPSVRIEGVLEGPILIVDANVFIRPSGEVRGSVLNVAGGFFPSEYATVEVELTDHGDAPYDVERTPTGARIVGLSRRFVLDPDGFRGVRIPTYDRVAGVTIGLGTAWYPFAAERVEPRVHAWGGWTTERQDWVGGASFALLGTRTVAELGAERTTATPDAWNRDELLNSLGVLVTGSDYRNYYASERAWVELTRVVRYGAIRLAVSLEDAASLDASRVWSIDRPDAVRPNPAISDGRIASASLGLDLDVAREGLQANFAFGTEGAARTLGGDYSFGRYVVDGVLAVAAFANHTVEVRTRVQGPMPGTDSLPRQRWSTMGGLETLETWSVGGFHGDRLALVRSTYAVPLDPFRVPFLGTPIAELVHSAGSAWTFGSDAAFEQALGVRLHFPLLQAFAFFDPSGERDASFGLAVQLRRRYPWEEPPI